MTLTYQISEVVPYINWVYFYHAWGISGLPDAEKEKLRQEAEDFLLQLEGKYQAYALFELFDACSEDDDIVLFRSAYCEECGVPHPVRVANIPCLRQQQGRPPFLCLADFISPVSSKIGLFSTSVSHGLETDFSSDPYQKMMAQLLADRLAEATAELMHEQVRKQLLTVVHPEYTLGLQRQFCLNELLVLLVLLFLIDEIIDMKQIGIRLTESGAMKPHASVSGLMISNL